jgi:hypothetical protein
MIVSVISETYTPYVVKIRYKANSYDLGFILLLHLQRCGSLQSYIPLSIHRCVIELVLLILSILTNRTDISESDNCIPDHYGPGPTNDLL